MEINIFPIHNALYEYTTLSNQQAMLSRLIISYNWPLVSLHIVTERPNCLKAKIAHGTSLCTN